MLDDTDRRLPPALETFAADLALAMAIAHDHARHGKPSRRSRLRAIIRRHTRISAGVALAALVVASAGIADASGVLGTAQPTVPGSGQRAPVALAPDPIDLAMLGIFRRPAQPGDALPVSGPATDPIGMATGENLALARKADFGALGAAWVIPADGGLCLRGEGNVNGVHTFGGEGCGSDTDGHPPYSQTLSGNASAPTLVLITGLVPDGVSSVTLTFDGKPFDVPVHENVYMAEMPPGVQSTSFTTANGTVVTLPGWPSHMPQGRPIPCSSYAKPPTNCPKPATGATPG